MHACRSTLEDPTNDDQLTRLSGATFPLTDFLNPGNSLAINRGSASDSLTINSLPEFDRALTIGTVAAPFPSVLVAGTVNLAAGYAFTVFAGSVQFGTAPGVVTLTGLSEATIRATGAIDFLAGSSLSTDSGDVTLTAMAGINIAAGATLNAHGTITGNVTNAGTISVPSNSLDFSGSFTQTAGSLVLNGGNLGGLIAFALQGGELRGTGMIVGQVNNSGAVIRPGGTGAAGTLTIMGDFFQTAGTLALEIGGTNPGVTFDVLNVSGVDAVGGNLSISTFPGFTPTAADSFILVNRNNPDPTNPGFSGFAEGTAVSVNGVTKRITYVAGDGNEIALVPVAAGTTLDATLNAGTLSISDVSSTGRDNTLTVIRSGNNLVITDAVETFSVAPAGGALSNGDHTLTIPISMVTGSLAFVTAGGRDVLTLNFTGGNLIPAGNIGYAGGAPTAGPDDQLSIVGGGQGTVTYNYINAHDGNVVMSAFGTVSYTGLEPIANNGTATDIIFNLPATANAATLGDAPGVTLSRLSGANFATTDFAAPSGSLTINRGTTTDTLTVGALPDFDASLIIGAGSSAFADVTFTGAITLADGQDITVSSLAITIASGASLATLGLGSIDLSANNISLVGTLDASGDAVYLQPLTGETLINLGGADGVGTLGLTNAELANVTAGSVLIGNSLSGALTVTAAISELNHLILNSGASVSGVAAITLAAGKDLFVNAGGPISLTGAVTVPGTAFLDAGSSNDITLNNAANSLGSVRIVSGATVSLRDDSGFDLGDSVVSTLLTVESDGTIGQSGALDGAGGLTKLGDGALILSRANTYAGDTTITGGTLLIAHPFAAQNSTVTVSRDNSLGFAAEITVTTFGGLAGGGDIVLTNAISAGVELSVGANGADTVYSGNLSGLGFLHKIGTGTLTLTGRNTQTGGTAIDSGIVRANSDRALGQTDATLTFTGGGTLQATATFATTRPIFLDGGTEAFEADAGKTLTLAGVISGTGNLSIGGAGKVEVTNTKNTNSGSTELDSNAVAIVNGVTINAAGARGEVIITPGATPNSIALIDLTGATAPARLTVTGPQGVTIELDRIVSNDPADFVKSIVLGRNVVFGDGVADSTADIDIAGRLGKLRLFDVNANTIISLGKGLAYLDTYKNKPNITLNDVLGAGVVIDATGDGVTAGGPGGGGLGKLVVNSWPSPGLIKTTQGIRSIIVKHGDFAAEVQVDPNHLGVSTVANVGLISIPNGSWVSPGMTVEGVVAKFLTKGLFDGSTISAGAFGTVAIKGNFDGSFVSTFDASVTRVVKGKTQVIATGNIGAVTVTGDFTGLITGDGSVGNVTLNGSGRFQGTLRGGSLGNIKAASFSGTPTGSDPCETITSIGSIGSITAMVGGITDYIVAAGVDLGADGRFDGVDDSYSSTYLSGTRNLAVKIGAVTIKRGVDGVTFVAGVDPGVDNSGATPLYGVYGDGNDTLVALPSGAVGKTTIGLLRFETTGTPTLSITPTATGPIVNAILAQAISGVQFGKVKVVPTTTAAYINSGDSSILVQVLS